MSGRRKIKSKSNEADTRPAALLVGGPFNLVYMHLNKLEDVIEVGHDVDNRHRYGKVTDEKTGRYLGCYSWLDPNDDPA